MDDKTYDKMIVTVTMNTPRGDDAELRLPVKAVRRLLNSTGKFPVPLQDTGNINVDEMAAMILDCLDEKIEGDVVNISYADGTKLRVFIK